VGPVSRDDPAPCRHSTDGDGFEPSRHSFDGHRSAPTATAPSPPATASTATDQRRRRRLGALPPQRRRPQISADGDGLEPSRRSVDGHRSARTTMAQSPSATAQAREYTAETRRDGSAECFGELSPESATLSTATKQDRVAEDCDDLPAAMSTAMK